MIYNAKIRFASKEIEANLSYSIDENYTKA